MRFRRSPLRRPFARAGSSRTAFRRYCPIPRRFRARLRASWADAPPRVRALVGVDDSADERMTNDVGGGEAHDSNPLHALEAANGIGEAGLGRVGKVDLVRVPADHHSAAHSEAGEEHLHLQRSGILRFVEDDERIVESSAAHESDGSNLDLAGRDSALDLLGWEHVVKRVVERTQIGIDLLPHGAGKEAQSLAGLDPRTREDQPVETSGNQLRDTLPPRERGLAGAGRPEREDHVVAGERLHVGGLHRRARDDRLLPSANHPPRPRDDLVLDDPVETGLRGHAEHGLDRFRIDVVTLVEPIVETGKHVAGARCRVGLALDLDPIAPRRDMNTEPLLDRQEVPVVIAEQRAEEVRLVELDLEACPLRNGLQFASGHQAATFCRRAPVMLFGPAARSMTSTSSPGSPSLSRWTDCSHGERPIIWCSCLPLRSMRTLVSTPTLERLKASW